ncbi:MAG: heparan-alpha-glucosaminide N-acetyltransferase domain-containing protein [Myxococcaceae bacterium]
MRIRSIDWLRGFVILLMTVDHAGNIFDAAHMHGDNAMRWVVGSPLPPGEFLTRWVTHLCAPVFILLAGASLALSDEKRRGQPGQTRFIVTRGLLIAALDPLWMSLGFAGYSRIVFQVLYAIGLSMVAMAFLRKLPSWVLAALAIAIQAFGELADRWRPEQQPWHGLWAFLFLGGPVEGRVICAYPLIPWLSLMLFGWVLGRWLLQPRTNRTRALTLAALGVASLALFAVVRGLDGYGNWNLHRDAPGLLQWLHVAKYPPSLSYCALELGLGLLLFAGLMALDDPEKPRAAFAPLALFGSTAFFFYLLHVHLLAGFEALAALDTHADGLAKTWLLAAAVIALLAWPCWLYRNYKRAHPNGWTRYL